jgi:hypothetical protein
MAELAWEAPLQGAVLNHRTKMAIYKIPDFDV